MIGKKQIMLSQALIKNSNWSDLIFSQVIPFTDHSDKILGCQLVLKHDKTRLSTVNLIDDIYNNLYTYKSQIAYVGQKRFQINKSDPSEFVIVISAKMCENIIQMNLFDQFEKKKKEMWYPDSGGPLYIVLYIQNNYIVLLH